MHQYKMDDWGDPYLVENNRLPLVPPNFHIRLSLTIIKYLGTWPPRDKSRSLYFAYTGLLFLFMLGIYLTVQFVNLVIIWGDLAGMVGTAFLLMTNSVHAYKVRDNQNTVGDFLVMTVASAPLSTCRGGNQKRIQRILDMIDSGRFSKDSEKFERIFTWYAWQGMYHHLRYQTIAGLTVFCWAFGPLGDAISGHGRRLPMEAWYPYDTKATPAFEITWAHQSIAVTLGATHNISMDTLITGLLNVACCQLEVLKKNILEINVHAGPRRPDDATLRRKVHSCIQHSVDVMGAISSCRGSDGIVKCIPYDFLSIFCRMRFIEEVRSIFERVILAQLLVNCIIICLTTFHITQMTAFVPLEVCGMVTHTCCMTYQLFIYCWHGNELTLQSQSLPQTIFSSNWWKFNKKLIHDLGIVITRYHKPVVFPAGPVIDLSLQSFVGILRLSYSFFTLLKGTTVSD